MSTLVVKGAVRKFCDKNSHDSWVIHENHRIFDNEKFGAIWYVGICKKASHISHQVSMPCVGKDVGTLPTNMKQKVCAVLWDAGMWLHGTIYMLWRFCHFHFQTDLPTHTFDPVT